MRSAFKNGFGKLLTALVLIVVLGAGARLIYLGGQHHEAVARERAATVAANFAKKIEPQIRALADLAVRQAMVAEGGPVSAAPVTQPGVTGSGTPLPGAGHFWLGMDDRVLAVDSSDSTRAAAIADEWQATDRAPDVPGPTLLGPLRQGSEWLMAAIVPVVTPDARESTPAARSAVAYENLDGLIAASHLGSLVEMGYQFELAQIEPRSARSRTFVGSTPEPLTDAVASTIRPPPGFRSAIPGSYLQLAIRPRNGWFPPAQLASEIGLLVFVAWLFAFGVHDLSHALQRSHLALASTRKRLHSTNQQLAREMRQRLSLQETFDHARFHDAFTGLPNRRYFMDQLDRSLRDVRARRRQRIAVVLAGVSRFKLISDTLGHTAGDELMVQAARRFDEPIAAFGGVLARWADDQFALLLPDAVSSEAVLQLAQLLQEKLHAPFELRRHRLVVSATIGITFTDSGQQRTEDVVREADLAHNVALRGEGPKLAVYAPDMAGQVASLVSLEADLHIALEKRELQLLFQPIVELRTRMMIGAEALLRWRHPVEGVLAPEKFLRIAEDAGLMGPIARWVILSVVKLAVEWRRRLPAEQKFFISINLSPTTLRDVGLGDYVATVLSELGLPPGALKFELTEAALIGNVAAAHDTLDRLHGMGVQLMLDDFGTGYSSLSNLQLFPFDFVKIDRPFVNRAGADDANTGMTAAMVQIARSLKLTAIAEIIESGAAAAALLEMGCEYGQGYYFSHPLDAGSAFHRLRSREPFEPSQVAETMELPPLSEDDSPTIMIPVGSMFDSP
jgi:diguanylate cyclase (GGDEF)-like protein